MSWFDIWCGECGGKLTRENAKTNTDGYGETSGIRAEMVCDGCENVEVTVDVNL